MNESALTARERRSAETSRNLRTEARRLTSERGLHGFTIEELCSEVGVSRRTFFNYFGSKENAILGLPVSADLSELDDPFVAAGPSASTAQMIDALAELLIARWEQMDLSVDEAEDIGKAFERVPELIGHLVELAAQGERHDIALLERREGLQVGDPTASIAVQVLGALIRPSVFEYFQGRDEAFRDIYLRRLALARDTLAS